MIDQIGIEVELNVMKLNKPIVCDFLPYTKKKPLDFEGNLLHKDASMFELAIKPCDSPVSLDMAWEKALNEARSMLPEGAVFSDHCCVDYDSDELAKDPYASVLGCGASENLYADSPMPDEYADNKRYAGMHVNVSTDMPEFIQPMNVLALDAYLGLWSVIHAEQEHKDEIVQRRTMYGRAGEFRMKPFGIEYRTLPASTWNRMDSHLLWRLTDRAMLANIRKFLPYAQDIQKAINTCDADLARAISLGVHGKRGVL